MPKDVIRELIHHYETKIEFSRMGHDHSLDFVKGLCILLVLLHHSTGEYFHQGSYFFLWGYPAVPLFLLIQVFHVYKYGYGGNVWNLSRTLRRGVLPFLIAEAIIFLFAFMLNPSISWRKYLSNALYWGGAGPGSYYPWIYIQFALLLPLLRPLFRWLGNGQLLAVFLGLSIGSEVWCSLTAMPEWIYRLLFLRYFFLIYLGYRLVEKGVVLNLLTVALSVLSLAAVYCFEIREVDWSPWFYHVEAWRTFHWICYFYIAYPMLYALCKFFYWLPANSLVENVMCGLGRHSYAIYLFQLFYFAIVAPYITPQLALLENPILETFLYVLISVAICSLPVISFISGLNNWRILGKILFCLTAVLGIDLYITWAWRPFYKPAEPFAPYPVATHDDDTLRVVMIGDSWVYFHQTLRRDSLLEVKLAKELGNGKVKLTAKGKGGTVSGEIYQYMSAERTMAKEYDLMNCTQEMIETGPDYCIISAGINDARQRRGKNYYVKNYMQIVRLLLANNIRPVVMEIPDVDVDEYYEGNTLFTKLRARICMRLLKTNLYGVGDYRQALKDSLTAYRLMDSVLYIPAASWNREGWKDKRELYTDDHFHLNLKGYELLDSTFAVEILKDYRLRRKQ